jgi:uncharacterized protein (DUF58 family)
MTAPTVARADAALRRLDLTVRRRLDGLLPGEHAGLRSGPGGEADTPRPYRPGQDDVRRIDWAVTARTGELHVRGSVAEHELETWVLVDASASMDFGTAVLEKRELAVAVVAAVGALTDAPGNRLGAAALTAAGLRSHRARPGRPARLALLRALADLPRHEPGPLAGARLGAGLERLRREHRRPGLRVVVSDLLPGGGDPAEGVEWEVPLRRLAARHDVVVVEVVDPRDAALPDVGALVLLDPETGRRREVRTDRRLRADFAAAAAAHRAATAAAVRRAGAAHLVLHTDGDWVTAIARFAGARRRTRRAAGRTR